MQCAWDSFIGILPHWMRSDVDQKGRHSLQELRLRVDKPPELITSEGSYRLSRPVGLSDLEFCINTASRYSPWSAQSARSGYITAMGGHRIGICGQAAMADSKMVGIRTLSSICLRVARDFPGIAESAKSLPGSVLILGSPGSGKTTLLRDLIRTRSKLGPGSISVVDEKGEIFPTDTKKYFFDTGPRTDVLSGCTKAQGIDAVLRNMGPETIAVDEITAQEDCMALANALWCGVQLLATAHAANKKELMSRKLYAPIVESGLFNNLLILRTDKSWYTERMVV